MTNRTIQYRFCSFIVLFSQYIISSYSFAMVEVQTGVYKLESNDFTGWYANIVVMKHIVAFLAKNG